METNEETLIALYSKIFNVYHKTRLTHDIHFNLTVEEAQLVLHALSIYRGNDE